MSVKKTLKMIVSICLILSSICFNNVNTNTLFADTSSLGKNNSFFNVASDVQSEQACTLEMLDTKSISITKGIVTISYQFKCKLNSFSTAEIKNAYINRFTCFFLSSKAIPIYNETKAGVIQNFIHNKDGKK